MGWDWVLDNGHEVDASVSGGDDRSYSFGLFDIMHFVLLLFDAFLISSFVFDFFPFLIL